MIIPQMTTFHPDACGDLIQGVDLDRDMFDKGINSHLSNNRVLWACLRKRF